MEFEFNLANLGQIDPAFVCLEGEPHLGIGKTVIPPLPFEARILGFLSSFHAAEKGFERQIHPHLTVLEHLGEGLFEFRMGFFPLCQVFIRLIQRDRVVFMFPCLFAQGDRIVIDPST